VAAGACACLVPSTIASNPRALARWIADNRITFWYSVPQVWVTLMNYADLEADALPHLKHILFAGEVFQPAYLKKLMILLPHAAYFNLYGPTETNVCTVYRVPDAGFAGDRPVPIGNACANTEIVVLNDRAEPVAIGEEGELFVRGSGVTPGYYKDTERIRAAFRQSPLGRHHGDMLYGTGDIVLRCDMENFTYVCRKDLMVKCSGFRIELPEVEQALARYDGIEEAVVVSHGDEFLGTARLHAFFTTTHGTDVSILRLKKHMLGILPRYMVPDFIERVTEIPRNANGKTDRQAIKGWCT
jgi:acyl-coenzyme A synthetase/AMP-(fatty) acid ligase